MAISAAETANFLNRDRDDYKQCKHCDFRGTAVMLSRHMLVDHRVRLTNAWYDSPVVSSTQSVMFVTDEEWAKEYAAQRARLYEQKIISRQEYLASMAFLENPDGQDS